MRSMSLVAIMAVIVACAFCSGCIIQIVEINNNNGGTQEVKVKKEADDETELEIPVPLIGGLKIRDSESLANIDLRNGAGTAVAVSFSSSVSADLESNFSSGAGLKWVGYETAPVTTTQGEVFTLSFEINNATVNYVVQERGRVGGTSWGEGFVGSFPIGPGGAAGIPTASEWGMIILTASILIGGVVLILRRRAPISTAS